VKLGNGMHTGNFKSWASLKGETRVEKVLHSASARISFLLADIKRRVHRMTYGLLFVPLDKCVR